MHAVAQDRGRRPPRQARHIAPTTAQQHFVLVVAAEDLFDERLSRTRRGRSGIEIDQARGDIRPFVEDGAREAPERSLPGAHATRRPVGHGHRTGRDDRETRRRRQPRCDQRLHGDQQVETAGPLRRERICRRCFMAPPQMQKMKRADAVCGKETEKLRV